MFKIFRINHIREKIANDFSYVFIQFKFLKICIKHKQLRTIINIFNDHNKKKVKQMPIQYIRTEFYIKKINWYFLNCY